MATSKSDSESAAPVTIDAGAARKLVSSGSHRYLDVRTPEEFGKGHYEGAINIPFIFFTPEGKLENTQFLEQVSAAFAKDDLIVVACASGIRSIRAAKLLHKEGFKHVKNMEGGYPAWVEYSLDKKKVTAKL